MKISGNKSPLSAAETSATRSAHCKDNTNEPRDMPKSKSETKIERAREGNRERERKRETESLLGFEFVLPFGRFRPSIIIIYLVRCKIPNW